MNRLLNYGKVCNFLVNERLVSSNIFYMVPNYKNFSN